MRLAAASDHAGLALRVRAFLGQAFEGGRHERRVAKLRELDAKR